MNPDVKEIKIMDVIEPARQNEYPMTSRERAEIEIAVSTAKQYPRDIQKCVADACEIATMDEQTASECWFTLPRAGKDIQGPSVRLAEIVNSCWGNIIAGCDIIGEDENFVYATGVARDLEKNTSFACKVRRRIRDKKGKRYIEDMIQTTGAAAAAIAYRNAIFKIIPKIVTHKVLTAAKKVAVGEKNTFPVRRQQVINRLVELGAKEDRILASIGKEKVTQINSEDLEKLIGIGTAIKDGLTTIKDAFPAAIKEDNGKTKTENLTEELKAQKQEEQIKDNTDLPWEDPTDAELGK